MNLSEEMMRRLLGNATAIDFGSKATSGSAAAVSTATAYTSGVVLTNAEDAGGITIWIGKTSGVAATPAAGNYPLKPGASILIPWGDLSGIYAIATSGTPTLGWIGVTT